MIPALTAALLHFLWQGALIALLLWIANALLHRATPQARYASCAAALVLMIVAPILTTLALYQRPAPLRAAADLVVTLAVSHTLPPARLPMDLRQWIVPVWALGVAILAVRLAFASRHVTRLRRTAVPVETALTNRAFSLAARLGVTRPVRILVSGLAEAPSVIGWLKPAVLLPAGALAGLDAAQIEAILAHEFAHIRRNDYLVNLLQTVVETLLFYHPAVWWVSSRMRQERELCCDDLAVRHCGDSLLYARALTRIERLRVEPSPAVAANGGSLLYRIERLTGAAHENAPSRLPLVLALVALAVPLVPHHAAATQQPATPAPAVQPAPKPAQPAAPAQSGNGHRGNVVVSATLSSTGTVLDASVVSGPLPLRAQALRFVLGRKVAAPQRGQDTVYLSLVLNDKGVVEMNAAPSEQFLKEDLRRTLAQEQQRLLQEAAASKLQEAELEKARQELAQAAEQHLDELRQTYSQNAPQIKSLEAQIRAMKSQLEQSRVYVEDRRDLLEAQLMALRDQLQRAQQAVTDPAEIKDLHSQIVATEFEIARSMRGAKVVRIDRGPLPSDVSLSVALGDTLSAVSIEQLTETVHKADPNLDIRFLREGDNQVSIRIVR